MTQKQNPTEAHRKELLERLESIIHILNDQGENDSNIPILRETVDASVMTTDEQRVAESSDISSEFKNQVHNSDPVALDQHNQPPLFEDSHREKNHTTNDEVYAKMENPFLPQHIRARLYSEKHARQSLENVTDENRHDVDSPNELHDSIIENLIAFYLPKIEADLRRRLKALTIKETDNKSQ